MNLEKRDTIFKNYDDSKKELKELDKEECDIIERYEKSEESERIQLKKQYIRWQEKYDNAIGKYNKARKDFLSFTGLDTLE